MYEAFKVFVASFVLPPGGPIVLVAVGLLSLRRYPRGGRALALTGAVVLWACSLPVVANALVAALGGARPLDMEDARRAEAIVILGGGVRPRALEYGGDTLGRLTLERVRYGAYLARQTGLPVLVTGGAPEAGVRTEAELMSEVLEREYGIQVRWAEREARDTRENAFNSAALLQAAGIRQIVLVVHGFDVRRAQALFNATGLKVLAAPTQVPRWAEIELADLLPSIGALYTSHFGLYEVLAEGREEVCRLIDCRDPRPARQQTPVPGSESEAGEAVNRVLQASMPRESRPIGLRSCCRP